MTRDEMIDTEQVRQRIEAARHGWTVTHPWTTADYAVQALLFTDAPALCDEIDCLRAVVDAIHPDECPDGCRDGWHEGEFGGWDYCPHAFHGVGPHPVLGTEWTARAIHPDEYEQQIGWWYEKAHLFAPIVEGRSDTPPWQPVYVKREPAALPAPEGERT